MLHKLFTLLLLVLCTAGISAQYNIEIDLKNYDHDTIVIGNYYADRTLVKDTVVRAETGKFIFAGTDTLQPGVYLVLIQPDNNYSQFLVDGYDTEFKLSWDTKDPLALKAEGSLDNQMFYEYMKYLTDLRAKADPLREKVKAAEAEGKEDKKAADKLADLDQEVKAYQNNILAKYPESITAMFIESTLQVDIPEYEGTEQEVQQKTYRFYKRHYFDNVSLGRPATLRTPFLHERVDYYMEKLTLKDPDSIISSIDYLLSEMEPAPDTYRYYTSWLTNKYANMKIVGMDAVYVHMVDKYYSTGKAPWVEEKTLKKMKENARNLRPILIGKPFPDVTTYQEDGTPVVIREVEAEYTVLVFWAHDCGHCTKAMPDVVDFYKEFQSRGVKLISICTKGGEKMKPCMEAVPTKGMEDFINTFDEYQRYRQKVYIQSTPKIFILNKDKDIIIKDIPAKELKNVMENVIKIDEEKKS